MLTFAHLTDIHITANTESWSTSSTIADEMFRRAVTALNQLDDLDFVLITGDMLDISVPEEIERFTAILSDLQKPWHLVPGNHDGYIHESQPSALPPDVLIPQLDPRMADPIPHAQQGRWNREVAPGVRLIGLDSTIVDDWAGRIEAEQREWLREQLTAHPDDLVLIAVHHPLHHLHPLNSEPYYANFVLQNGAEIEAVLDEYPTVKMVLSGHHHAHQLRVRNGRLHVATAALSGYPNVYRLIRIEETESGHTITVSTHSPADEETLAVTHGLALKASPAERLPSGRPADWVDFISGTAADQGMVVGL